jgi:hypothetical protein
MSNIIIMSNFPVYAFCALVAASLAVLLGMSTEFFVAYVNDILIPCQHDSVWRGGQCVCDNTRGVFAGQYCDECQCQHLGICTMTEITESRWGCRCPSHQKWVGTLCDKCYAVENKNKSSCRGECKEVEYQYKHYGPKCNTVCMPLVSSNDPHCTEVFSGGGECNACNNHGVCTAIGQCECDKGWFTPPNGEKCSRDCKSANINCPEDRGFCDIIGGELQCLCNEGYYGKNCADTCPGEKGLPCSGHGTCDFNDNNELFCLCEMHYTGEDCSLPCPGDTSFPNACSGHGICSDNGGVAQCECGGTWDGLDCSCSPKYTCSGHGQCQEDGSCACFDETDPEIHFNGSACESCEEHWFGRSCHLRCEPGLKYESGFGNGLNIGCNGHGSCELETIGVVEHITCQCSGTDPDTFCATCMPDYYPDIRLPNITAVPACFSECNDQTCSFLGKCNQEYDGTNNLCICDNVTVGIIELDTVDPVQFCSTCKKNWYPSKMDDANRCTYYCADDGNVETTQDKQWIVFESGDFDKDYDLLDDVDAQKVCSSVDVSGDQRYAPDADCRVCSGAGTCRANGECKCSLGTTGVYCNIQCNANEQGTVCSNHGRCVRNELDMWFNPYTTDYRCECTPYDTYTSETRQRLIKRGFQVDPPPPPDYHGQFCDFHCPRYNEEICNERGDCKTVVASDERGFRRTCQKDLECSDISGAFCDRLTTPWDSLMTDESGKVTGKSFFSNGVDAPGYYTCARSDECIDSIFSVEWDEYCVNMLNGWYPNILNTAECTYQESAPCREQVEEFFISEYNGTDKTWCELAIEELTPSLTKCGPNSYANEDKFKQETVPVCYEYTLETSCNAQEDCIYDQTRQHILATDNICEEQSIDGVCNNQCRLDTNQTCETKTYCRAKTCSDIMYENNVESLCFDLPEACPGTATDWTDFCAASSGRMRAVESDLNSLETFFNCYMYEHRYNPQLVSKSVPGGIPLNGMLRVFGEDVPISEYRQSFIKSRRSVEDDSCSTLYFTDKMVDNVQHSDNGFCSKHLESVVPKWYRPKDQLASWYLPWLVVCPEGEDSLWKNEGAADKRIKQAGRGCVKYYKSPRVEGDDWGASSDQKDTIVYESLPWTLVCLNNDPIQFSKLDYDQWPETACKLIPNWNAQRWGQTPWTPDDVQRQFSESCSWLETGPWIPKSEPVPTLCDMGACSPEHQCLLCSETDCLNTSASVMCISNTLTDCRDQNPCQKNGNCYQPPQMLYQTAYLCDWFQNSSIRVEVDGFMFDGNLSQRGLVSVFNAFNDDYKIPRRANITIGGVTRLITSHWITSTSDITFNWIHELPLSENIAEKMMISIEKCDDSQNWASFCNANTLGVDLSTHGPSGLVSGWSGTSELSQDKLLVTRLQLTNKNRQKLSITHNGHLKIVCSSQTNYSVSFIEMTVEPGQCLISAVYGPVLVTSLKIDATEQILSFEHSLKQDVTRSFYFPEEDEQISGFESWSFLDGHIKNVRPLNKVLPQIGQCSTETCSSFPRGVRWNIDHQGDTRVSGWGKMEENSNHVMDMQLQNNEFEPILSVYIYQHRLYVNGEKTECKVLPGEWFQFLLDAKHESEIQRQTKNSELQFSVNTTVFDQQWSLRVQLNDCDHETTAKVISSALTRKHYGRISSHYRWLQTPNLASCRDICHGDTNCKQFSWHGHGCHLHDTRCHEDSQCMHGAHILHAFHSHRVRYFEIFNADQGSSTYWSNLRVEPLIDSPFNCVHPSDIPERWSASFLELYSPFNPDVTAVCNSLVTQWQTMPGYIPRVCSGSDCAYKEHDLEACAKQLEYRTPESCTDSNFNALNWTSYCRYATSFEPIHTDKDSKQIPFLGGIDVNFEELCVTANDIMSDATSICEDDMSPDWFSDCFKRSSSYESYCSDECLDEIETMLADNDKSGICTIRKQFLDIKDEFDSACNCDLSNIIITDFCLIQTAYHEDEDLKIPELYHSQCDLQCTETLKVSMNRSVFRNWCKDFADGEMKGVCSKTVCECNTDDNPGVAGRTCDLNCPTGISDGEELACSGPNGQCFAIDHTERIPDEENQKKALEFRTATSLVGPDVPIWIRGPEPYINGRCQCQLGSGSSCSIPCDRCNNGTYGENLASQYGICDSFNGICRGLAPFMRFNTQFNDEISYNTTAFESSNGLTLWKYPERFLYEDDQILFDLAMRDVLDAKGFGSGLQLPEDVSLLEEKHIEGTLLVFRELCWDDDSEMSFLYLNNSRSVQYKGINLFTGTPLNLKTRQIPASPKCTEIRMDTFNLCFADGQMFASKDNTQLIVISSGIEEKPLEKMTFSKRDYKTLYAFGGEREFSTSSQLFNDLYKITVSEMSWYPNNIIFVHWERIEVSGSKPRPQLYAPIFSYTNEIYLLSTLDNKHTLYKLPLNDDSSWLLISTFDKEGMPIYMDGTPERVITVYFAESSETLVDEWSSGDLQTSNNIYNTAAAMLEIEYTCDIELRTNSVTVGGNTVATYSKTSTSVQIYIEEWLTIDVASNANSIQRFQNAIKWYYADPPTLATYLSEATDLNIMKALEYVERIYMHQARWSLDKVLSMKEHFYSQLGMENIIRVRTDSSGGASIKQLFSSISPTYFGDNPSTKPNVFTVTLIDNEPHRKMLIVAQFTEQMLNFEQEIDFDSEIIIVESTWTQQILYVKIKRKSGIGFVEWVTLSQRNTWVLVIHLEEYRNQPTIEFDTIFDFYATTHILDTWPMMRETAAFLSYSSSHCSLTAGEACPGLMPYTSLPCSGRGRCGISCQCVCEVAKSILETDPDVLQNPEWTKSPWRGNACELTCPGYDGYDIDSICSGQGKCQRDGTCSCNEEYTGDACQFQCPKETLKDGTKGEVCSTHGGCGTKSVSLRSFAFVNDKYRDTLSETNRRAYEQALSNFYGSCDEFNYFHQNGDFGGSVQNRYPAHSKLKEAQIICNNINKNLRLDITQEDNRVYPSGRCMGIRKQGTSYVPVTLKIPRERVVYFTSVPIFKCLPADCTLEIDENDDRTMKNLQHTLIGSSFEFFINYEHGVSSGRIVYIVNGEPVFMEFMWDTTTVKIDISTLLYGKTTVVLENIQYQRLKMTIELNTLTVKFYPMIDIIAEDNSVWLAPNYIKKYQEILHAEQNGRYFLITSEDTGDERKYKSADFAEYDCDLEPECIGLIRWDEIYQETLYSLFTDKTILNGWGLHTIDSETPSHTYLKKMSFYYRGRSNPVDTCEKVMPGQSKYPTVAYKEYFNIPIKDIDLSSALDEETGAVEVGDGVWTKCWKKVNVYTKMACYEHARDIEKVYGFAFSEYPPICLVYTGISKNTKIKLDRFTSEQRLSLDDPCDEDADWISP